MAKPTIRSRPPRLDADREEAADAFIGAAEQPPEAPGDDAPEKPTTDKAPKKQKSSRKGGGGKQAPPSNSREALPWEDPKVREDVKKLFSLRLPEPLMLKLQYISSETGKSMHQYCLDHLVPAIERDADELSGTE